MDPSLGRTAPPRPAFYALSPGGWRDLVTLLHPPYTAWHLSYVAIGAALAPAFALWRMGATLGAFALALGVGAHALDELAGRPLGTRLSNRTLIALAAGGLGAAVAIGVVGAIVISAWLLVPVAAGAFIAVAYNLELFGGRFHSDAWFALAWGGFPALTGWLSQAVTVRPGLVLIVAACCALSAAQRRLSAPARELRRRTASVTGAQHLRDGRTISLDAARLAAPLEGALGALSWAMALLAAALVVARAA